eukprot:COSAG02_NODE_2171_length_9598_cov_30.756817_3_plen_55_part_00
MFSFDFGIRMAATVSKGRQRDAAAREAHLYLTRSSIDSTIVVQCSKCITEVLNF